MKVEANENDNANANANEAPPVDLTPSNETPQLDTSNTSVVAQAKAAIEESGMIDLNRLSPMEQKEIVQEILQSESEIEALALQQVSSSDILNQPINILDAGFRQIPDEGQAGGFKACVSFVCEFAEGHTRQGEQFTVLKGSNAFNNTYVNYFDKIRGIMSKPLQNYEFVEDARYKVGKNVAHVLRKIPAGVLAAGRSR